jgi:predicted acyl esterase
MVGTMELKQVKFRVEGGVSLAAWLFIPNGDGPFPAITMAHGFGVTKFHSLERAACFFAGAGFVVLVHDHRGFGESEGEPRQDINPWVQISD